MASHPQPKTQDHTRTVNDSILSEQGRLDTFQTWPYSAAVDPPVLAKAGFYYLGQADRVRCAFCNGTLKNWQHGDNPFTEHRKHFGQCRFIRGEDVGNIPLEPRSNSEPFPPSGQGEQQKLPSKGEDLKPAVGTSVRLNLQHPDFQSVSSREASYVGWPPEAVQRPPALVDAGFFYIGDGDGVRCFCCDGALRNWEPEDDPWIEHARWFPRCPYLLQQKGAGFISNVRAQYAATTPAHHSPPPTRREPSPEDPLMSSEVVQQAVDMGFDRGTVLSVIHQHSSSSGGQLPQLDELVSMLLGESTGVQRSVGERTVSPVGPQSSIGTPPSAGAIFSATQNPGEPGSKDRILCKICLDREVAVTFLPCGHLVCCTVCANHVRKCPMCRQNVRAHIRTYLC